MEQNEGRGLLSEGDVGRCWIEGRGVTVKGRCGEMLDGAKRGAGVTVRGRCGEIERRGKRERERKEEIDRWSEIHGL